MPARRIPLSLRPRLPEGPATAYLAAASRSAAAAGRGGGGGRAAPPLLTAAPRRLGAGPAGLGARLRLPPAAASPCSLRGSRAGPLRGSRAAAGPRGGRAASVPGGPPGREAAVGASLWQPEAPGLLHSCPRSPSRLPFPAPPAPVLPPQGCRPEHGAVN